MAFVVIVQENKNGITNLSAVEVAPPVAIELYRQSVELLDLPALIATVNRKRRAPRNSTPKVAKP